MIAIIDFDGTLTAEEKQAEPLSKKSLATLSREILDVPVERLENEYALTRERLLAEPWRYHWDVNGLIASYCNEGAFILNTTTLQVMLRDTPEYRAGVEHAFPSPEYDAVADCTNWLFHRHTAELPPAFRPGARRTLVSLMESSSCHPMILTNSLGDKVRRLLQTLDLPNDLPVLGDTRQYDMDADWERRFRHPDFGDIQMWSVAAHYTVDLRRPIYYAALTKQMDRDHQIVVVADSFSLPGALPLMMGIPFCLLITSYTPQWCREVVKSHPLGYLLEDIGYLPDLLDCIAQSGAGGRAELSGGES